MYVQYVCTLYLYTGWMRCNKKREKRIFKENKGKSTALNIYILYSYYIVKEIVVNI